VNRAINKIKLFPWQTISVKSAHMFIVKFTYMYMKSNKIVYITSVSQAIKK